MDASVHTLSVLIAGEPLRIATDIISREQNKWQPRQRSQTERRRDESGTAEHSGGEQTESLPRDFPTVWDWAGSFPPSVHCHTYRRSLPRSIWTLCACLDLKSNRSDLALESEVSRTSGTEARSCGCDRSNTGTIKDGCQRKEVASCVRRKQNGCYTHLIGFIWAELFIR